MREHLRNNIAEMKRGEFALGWQKLAKVFLPLGRVGHLNCSKMHWISVPEVGERASRFA